MEERPGATRRLKAGLRAGRGLVTTVTHRRRRVLASGPAPDPSVRPGMARGASFAGYTILRQLGAGGMAEVYLALHPRLPRRDVIKVLAEAITADTEFRERFNREADLAATLWHPHIVGVHDRGEFQGQLWISMDYVEGTDASRLVKEAHPQGMPVGDVCAILEAVAGALDYAHDRGLLHRDVKPANILLTHPETDPHSQERRILLADFGVARHLADISGITQTNVAVGTVAYAAPEQLAGSNIDRRADQYALAATAFHLLTGAPPFRNPNPVAVISQHLHDEPPRLSDYRPDLAQLDDVFARALAKNPEERFERCRMFAAAVRAGSDEACEADSPEPPLAQVAPSRRVPSRVRMAAALVCAVLIAVAATWSTLYSFEPDPSQPNPALAARPAAPAPSAAVSAPSGRVLDGIYRLDLNRAKRTTNGTPIRHDGGTTNWWAFRSVCTPGGCAATGVRLDDATHQVADTTDGGETDTLKFAAGYWQGASQQIRTSCHQANQTAQNTQQETVALSLALQSDGTLRGVQTETVGSNECGAQGAVLRVPVVATRVGDVPPNLPLSDPAQVMGAAAVPATRPMPPVLSGSCSDVDKLGYDQTSNEQVVCEGGVWSKAPITTGVHSAGSSCDRPDIPVFAMSASSDGYLIECNPVTRVWARHS
ncbi:serine/threonine protein kinase [Mycobacterium paragordonae]|uniref:serine/threonine-protein kinase n=1 Tax=Mycobacterium paragordonae TaxID=1389713 RepID=UPI0009F2D715|nr:MULTISPECIES: serine/threonine-protein kinase [Mycobacterium]TDK95849.1 serine/threonine protein kinase [Mycobacterium paragordonae]